MFMDVPVIGLKIAEVARAEVARVEDPMAKVPRAEFS